MTEAEVLDFTLLVIAGVFIGLVVRYILGDKAYGAVADALLGTTGAFAADFAIGPGEITWSSRALLTIWAAAFLPCLAHFLSRRLTRVADREVGQQRLPKMNSANSPRVGMK
jgi:uncharacterized membrane protein YeaQ/YmgE (transglycosylase-associated protein family)